MLAAVFTPQDPLILLTSYVKKYQGTKWGESCSHAHAKEIEQKWEDVVQGNKQTFIGCKNHSWGDCRDSNSQHYLHFICFILPVIEMAVMIPRIILKVTNFPTLFCGFHALNFKFVWLTVMPERYHRWRSFFLIKPISLLPDLLWCCCCPSHEYYILIFK